MAKRNLIFQLAFLLTSELFTEVKEQIGFNLKEIFKIKVIYFSGIYTKLWMKRLCFWEEAWDQII